MIEEADYCVRVIDLPYSIGGMVSPSPDGFMNIYINAHHSPEKQKESLAHELRHIERGDFQKDWSELEEW